MQLLSSFLLFPFHAYGLVYLYHQQLVLFCLQWIAVYLGYQGLLPLFELSSNFVSSSSEKQFIRKCMSIAMLEIVYSKIHITKYILLFLKFSGEVPYHPLIIFGHYVTWSILEDPIYIHPLRYFIDIHSIPYYVSILRQSVSIALIIYSGALQVGLPDNYLPPMLAMYFAKLLIHIGWILFTHYLFSLHSFEMLKQFYFLRVLIHYDVESENTITSQTLFIMYICIMFTIITSQI